MPSGHRREHRRSEEPSQRRYRSSSRDTTDLSEEVSVSPSNRSAKTDYAPSLPDRSTESYYSNASSTRSDLTLCIDNPSAVCPSMRMNQNDSKTTYQLRDGSMLEILDKADGGGKSIALKLQSGEEIYVDRSSKGHSLMMRDKNRRVVHMVGTDWTAPERVYRA